MTNELPTLDTESLTRQVQELYTHVAERPDGEFHFPLGRPLAERLGYPAELLDAIPAAALASFAGVGYALELARLAAGDTVLDLGSGSGTDAFAAAARVGRSGHVTGVDMTAAQIAKAQRLGAGVANVSFRLGRLEQLPLADASVDVVISNGVINLCPDKPRVFAEVARVLAPGGRMAIADIVAATPLPHAVACDADLWAACIGGAAAETEYHRAIEQAGLTITAQHDVPQYEFLSSQARSAAAGYGVRAITLAADRR
jgi:ubiquinone/menaquinone biosynthesis C-methylase UbiE